MNNRVINFKSLRKKVPATKSGERINDVYKLTYDDDGTARLVVCGKLDIYDQIQSHAASCDIKAIIERCTVSGDMSELYKTPGFYADMTIMPKTRVDALKALAEAENCWSQLPKEAKEKFDNDMSKFFASAFSEEWYLKLEVRPDEKVEVKEVGEVNE